MPSEMRSLSTSTSRTTALNDVALVELFDDLLARTVPVEVGKVHHAVNVAVEADEQAEFGLVLDFAFDFGAGRMAMRECLPTGSRASA